MTKKLVNPKTKIYPSKQITFKCEGVLTLYTILYRFLPPFVVEWHIGRKEIYTCGLHSPRYRLFYLNFFIVLGIINLTASTLVFLNASKLPVSLVYATTSTTAVTILCVFCSCALMNHLHHFVYKFKCMKRLACYLYHQLSYQNCRHHRNLKSDLWSKVTVALKFLVVAIVIFPITVSIIRTLSPGGNKDPVGWAIYQMTPSPHQVCSTGNLFCKQSIRFLMYSLQFVFIYMRSVENCRFVVIFFALFLYWLELQQNCLRIFEDYCQDNCNIDKVLLHKYYSAWRIAHLEFFDGVTSVVMSVGFIMFVACNVITFRAFSNVPSWRVYIHFPMISIISGFFTKTLLTCITDIHVKSEKIVGLMKRKSLIDSKSGIKLRSKVALQLWTSARPVTYSCGQFFELVKGAEACYVYLVMLRTAEGLLLTKLE